MKSPFADSEMVLRKETDSATFRGDVYEYVRFFYECPVTHERFTTSELDDLNTAQVYNQYRERYNIPHPDDIAEFMGHYGLSNSNLCDAIGVDETQVARYLSGEVPTKDIGKAIMSLMRDIPQPHS